MNPQQAYALRRRSGDCSPQLLPAFTGLNNWYTSYRDALQVITATTKLPKIIAKEIHLDKLINISVL